MTIFDALIALLVLAQIGCAALIWWHAGPWAVAAWAFVVWGAPAIAGAHLARRPAR